MCSLFSIELGSNGGAKNFYVVISKDCHIAYQTCTRPWPNLYVLVGTGVSKMKMNAKRKARWWKRRRKEEEKGERKKRR